MHKEERCYWCGDVATSREHIPPRGLFRAIKGHKRLITVPSCSLHNENKSDLDNYFVATLGGMMAPFNEERMKFANERLSLMASHYRGSLNDFFGGEAASIWVPGLKFTGGVIHQINMGNISVSLEGIARGLWYHSYNEVFRGELVLFEPSLPDMAYVETPPQQFNFTLDTQKQGDCPAVFWYQLAEHKDLSGFANTIPFTSAWSDVTMFKLCFFDCIQATVICDQERPNQFVFIQSDQHGNLVAHIC